MKTENLSDSDIFPGFDAKNGGIFDLGDTAILGLYQTIPAIRRYDYTGTIPDYTSDTAIRRYGDTAIRRYGDMTIPGLYRQ